MASDAGKTVTVGAPVGEPPSTNPERPSTLTGTRMSKLGKYEVIAKLGQGGMAEVYLAVARGAVQDFRKLVVLKVLHDNLRDDQQFVEMFMKEARIAARLAHPNVVHTYTVGQEEGRYCIVMEYLEGISLSAMLKRSAELTPRERLPLLGAVTKALSGLHYVHEFRDYDGTHLRLVHRDVKPGNIFITFDGQVKVLDFGVAKVAAADSDATASQVVKGTVQYMAPEALDVSRTVDRRMDVFGAGLLVWEIACGRRIWGELSHLQILRHLAAGKLPELHADGETPVPARVVEICQKAIAPDPDTRHPTALALKNDLEEYLASAYGRFDSDDLAELVNRLFGDLRERRAVAIKERLAVLDEHKPAVLEEGAFPNPIPTFSSPSNSIARTLLPRNNTNETAVLSQRRRRHLGLAIAAVVPTVILGTALVISQVRSMSDASALASSSIPAAVVVPTPAPGAAAEGEPAVEGPITITIAVDPPEARLFLDGEPLEGNPAKVPGAKGIAPRELVVRAEGYEERRLTLALDHVQTLELALRPRDDRGDGEAGARRRKLVRPGAAPSLPERERGGTERVETVNVSTSGEPAPVRPGDEMPKPAKKKKALELDQDNPWAG